MVWCNFYKYLMYIVYYEEKSLELPVLAIYNREYAWCDTELHMAMNVLKECLVPKIKMISCSINVMSNLTFTILTSQRSWTYFLHCKYPLHVSLVEIHHFKPFYGPIIPYSMGQPYHYVIKLRHYWLPQHYAITIILRDNCHFWCMPHAACLRKVLA